MESEKQGDFYILPSTDQYKSEFDIQKKIVCNLAKIQWRLGNSVFIACENKSQAEEIDEDLWKFDLDSFLPHSLFNTNSSCRNVPIVIYWDQCCYDRIQRDILINLIQKQDNLFMNFTKIVDFVSTKSVLKKLARIRYKSYKNFGFSLRIIDKWVL